MASPNAKDYAVPNHIRQTVAASRSSTRSELSNNDDEHHDVDNQQASTVNAGEHLTGLKLYTLLLALLILVFMFALDAAVLATAVPRITDEFHTIADVGWYGSAYMISTCCLQPLTGKIFTFFPLKMSLFAFVALFELGSILCATANSSMMLVIGRAVAGMGSAGLAGGSMSLIGVAAPPDQRPTLIGIVMSMLGIGQLAGPLIGGALTQHVSWRWCFWINLPIGAVTVPGVLAVRLPPQEERPKLTRNNFFQNFDMVGFILFAPASIMLLLALQWGGNTYAWSSPTIIGLFCGSGATYIIFAIWEYQQGDNAMFPPSLLRQLIISSSVLNSFLFGGSLIFLGYYLPLWFQVVKHASPTQSAINTLPSFISQTIFAIISGPLCTLVGIFSPFFMFGASLSSIGAGLMSTFTPTTPAAKWIGYQILNGVGRGLAFQQPLNTVQAALTKSQLPTGMALVIWAQFFGAAVFLALGQTMFSSLLVAGLHRYAPDVDPAVVLNAGATDYTSNIPAQFQREVLQAYNAAITQAFYLPAVVSGVTAIVALGMGWKRVVGKKAPKNGKGDVNEEKGGDGAVVKDDA